MQFVPINLVFLTHNSYFLSTLPCLWLKFQKYINYNSEDLFTAPRIIPLSPLSLANDVTDATLGTIGLWLGTQTGSGVKELYTLD